MSNEIVKKLPQGWGKFFESIKFPVKASYVNLSLASLLRTYAIYTLTSLPKILAPLIRCSSIGLLQLLESLAGSHDTSLRCYWTDKRVQYIKLYTCYIRRNSVLKFSSIQGKFYKKIRFCFSYSIPKILSFSITKSFNFNICNSNNPLDAVLKCVNYTRMISKKTCYKIQ